MNRVGQEVEKKPRKNEKTPERQERDKLIMQEYISGRTAIEEMATKYHISVGIYWMDSQTQRNLNKQEKQISKIGEKQKKFISI